MQAAAPKIPPKRTLAATNAVSAPSPAPSNASNDSRADVKDVKRKREPQNVVFSQPQATGYGVEAYTQVTYVIEFLKKKNEPKTFTEILQYLSLHPGDANAATIARILKKHDRVHFTPDPKASGSDLMAGVYAHRPVINVRTKAELIAYLQRKSDAQGVSVKDLKDGWPDCEGPLDELEKEHKILVTRTKKDNHARMVWSDDPSLVHSIDAEFSVMWHQTELPSVDELVRKLQEAGQKPASEDPSKRVKAAGPGKEKKKRATKKGGKITNTHMQFLLRDYSHLKR